MSYRYYIGSNKVVSYCILSSYCLVRVRYLAKWGDDSQFVVLHDISIYWTSLECSFNTYNGYPLKPISDNIKNWHQTQISHKMGFNSHVYLEPNRWKTEILVSLELYEVFFLTVCTKSSKSIRYRILKGRNSIEPENWHHAALGPFVEDMSGMVYGFLRGLKRI